MLSAIAVLGQIIVVMFLALVAIALAVLLGAVFYLVAGHIAEYAVRPFVEWCGGRLARRVRK